MSCNFLVLPDPGLCATRVKTGPCVQECTRVGARAVTPKLHALTRPPQSSLDHLEGAVLCLV